jgi:ACT domain-containing protein
MRTIITVIGKDKPGIVAGITAVLYEMNINILDVSQTIMDSYFTMTMLVDHTKATKSFDEAKVSILAASEPLDVQVRIQRVDIFDAMHSL